MATEIAIQPAADHLQDDIAALENGMRDLLEVRLHRRAEFDVLPGALRACWMQADVRNVDFKTACLPTVQDLLRCCLALGAPPERYQQEPWISLGL